MPYDKIFNPLSNDCGECGGKASEDNEDPDITSGGENEEGEKTKPGIEGDGDEEGSDNIF